MRTTGRGTGVGFGFVSFVVVPLFLVALGVAEVARLVGLLTGRVAERWNDHRAWTRTRRATSVPPLRAGQHRGDQ